MATVTRIGIAGYMGAGKSTCARSFESGGALLIDADAEAKSMMARSREIRDGLRRAFGDAVVSGEGLRFDVLGRLAFESAESLRKLNAVTHPPLVSRVGRLVRGCEKPLCVLDAALIPLFNIESWFDLCVWVEAPFDVRYGRLKAKLRGMDETELARRMRLQEEVMPAPAEGRWAMESAEPRRKLNAVTHPPLVSRVERLVRGCEKPLCVLDAALIPLFNIESWFDLCVWVEAPFDVRYSRLKAKLRGMDETELARRMRLQEEVMPAPAEGRWAKIPDGDCRGYVLEKLREMGVDKNILEPPAGSAQPC